MRYHVRLFAAEFANAQHTASNLAATNSSNSNTRCVLLFGSNKNFTVYKSSRFALYQKHLLVKSIFSPLQHTLTRHSPYPSSIALDSWLKLACYIIFVRVL